MQNGEKTKRRVWFVCISYSNKRIKKTGYDRYDRLVMTKFLMKKKAQRAY